jgi:hypothetical protein
MTELLDTTPTIASIAQSNSLRDYSATVVGEADASERPAVDDYPFGQPVLVPVASREDERVAVSVVYTTQIVDPGMGGVGPSLGSGDVASEFKPNLVSEPTTVLGIAVLGTATPDDSADGGIAAPDHGIPRHTLQHGAHVVQAPPETFAAFHRPGGGGETPHGGAADGDVRLAYYPRLVEVAGGFAAELVEAIADRLRATTAGQDDLLGVIERRVAQQAARERGVL